MTLHASVKEVNILRSLRYFFVSNIELAEGIPVSWDANIAYPYLRDRSVTKWMTFSLGSEIPGSLSIRYLDVVLSTRKDSEGEQLSGLVDTLKDSIKTVDDRIVFYDTSADPGDPGAWVVAGYFYVSNISVPSGNAEAPDETKIKRVVLTLKWGTVQ